MLVSKVDRPLLSVFGTYLAEGKRKKKKKGETAVAFIAAVHSPAECGK